MSHDVRFSLDPVAIRRLHDLAEAKHLSVGALLRNLVYTAVNTADLARKREQETGEDEDPRQEIR